MLLDKVSPNGYYTIGNQFYKNKQYALKLIDDLDFVSREKESSIIMKKLERLRNY